MPYPSFADQAGRFAAMLGYPGLPATFVVDATGHHAVPGLLEIDEDTLVPLLDEVLGPVAGRAACLAADRPQTSASTATAPNSAPR